MITIQEHLNKPKSKTFFDSLALGLWDELNQKIRDRSRYKYNSLFEKCKKFSIKATTPEYLHDYANDDIKTAQRHKKFFEFLIANNGNQLKRIIVARPNQFNGIKNRILRILKVGDLYTINSGKYSQTKFGELLSETIFSYKNFRNSKFCLNLFTQLGFDSATCAYCNDNMLSIVEVNSESLAYLELDHFLCKSQNPYFAISFFNLIPSCHACNAIDKGNKLFNLTTHVHPYYQAFEDVYEFKISPSILIGGPIVNISIESRGNKPLDVTLGDLNFEARYSTKLKEAENLARFFLDYHTKIGTPDEEMFKDSIFKIKGVPQNRRDILKSQRGKMNRDILKYVDPLNKLNIT